LEKRSVSQTTSAVKELMKFQELKANKLVNGVVFTINSQEVIPGDILVINSGDKIPVDGEIIWGEASINESMLTGESLPVEKTKYDQVIGGTLIEKGAIHILVSKTGKHTVLSQIIDLMKHAQSAKPPIQKLGDQVAAILARFGSFATVKIKVAEAGQSQAEDIQRIKAVRALYPNAKLRLDANGNLSVEQALQLIRDLDSQEIPLEYFEQPVETIAELAEVKLTLAKDQIPVKIAADESVRKVTDPLAVAQANAADILVLKVAPLGGISRSLEIAREAGLPVVISSALDSSIGISMGAHLAALLPELNFANLIEYR
jgi:hypothetical protein